MESDTNLNEFDPMWDEIEVLDLIRNNPGLKTGELGTRTKMDTFRLRDALARLQKQGKIRFAGWEVSDLSITQGEKKSDGAFTQGDDSPILRVRWKSPARSQRKRYARYAYLYSGVSQVCYIAGPHSNPLAREKVDQVEKWIELGLPLEAIEERIDLLRSGKWRNGDRGGGSQR